MHSCLYTGCVAHVRREPVIHRFRYAIAMAYLDLDEAAELVRASRLLSAAAFAPLSFRATDHARGLGDVRSPAQLADAVRHEAGRATGLAPTGPVRLLTQLRQWGAFFSPLNLYFCFDAAGQRVDAIVAEVSNSPWNERRRYVLSDAVRTSAGDGGELRYLHAKDFHVSPFMGMERSYQWRLSVPGERLRVAIRSSSSAAAGATETGAAAAFDATLVLRRRAWSDWELARVACRFPAASAQILAAIYWQAFRLWTKRCRYYPHPRRAIASA